MSYEKNRFENPLDAGHLRNQRLNGGRTATRTTKHPSDNEVIANHTALEIAYVPSFRLGVRWVAPAANEIDGMRIDAKAMDVLTALVAVAPGVVSTMQLMDRVWSRVVVGDNVVHQAIATLRKALGDDARAPRYVQSIPKRGYRLLAHVEQSTAGNVVPIAPTPRTAAAHEEHLLNGVDAHIAVAVHTPAARYLLAVLAFDNLSGDPALDCFSDGVSEEIRDTVARCADVKVIGRASSFQFRGPDKAAAHVAAQVHATHVLDGSVRRSGARVRISIELVECASAVSLWSKRFDRDLSDIFALQDEIAGAVAQALGGSASP